MSSFETPSKKGEIKISRRLESNSFRHRTLLVASHKYLRVLQVFAFEFKFLVKKPEIFLGFHTFRGEPLEKGSYDNFSPHTVAKSLMKIVSHANILLHFR